MLKASAVRSRHLAPGDTLGKYEVIRQIAVGGMAELYLARTVGIEGFEKLVVVKRILPQYVANKSFVDMFLNEARLAATLHHPNVAQVYDIGVEDGDYFFAMEYVHGEDLDHMAVAADEQGVPISLDAALTLGAGLCAGLHYAHDRVSAEGKPLGIVHRDVSPSNVLVSYDGAVKLVDFGIARASSRPGTTQGGLKGKIAYMSPEQCRAKGPLDRRSDIYSIGTILYQLTTGRLPFQGETEYQVLNQIVNDDVPPPTSIVPSFPPVLQSILLRALARDPDQRFKTALEMQGALEDFAHEVRLRVSPLVLARLMGSLFPSRLEEWRDAKAQGAFFVEQHVVRTLIESGKTPDRSDPVTAARVAAAAICDDESTHVNQAPLMDLGDDTAIGDVPISTAGRPTVPSQGAVPPPLSAGLPGYPLLASGVLVSPGMPGIPLTPSHAGAPLHPDVQLPSAQLDKTQHVRIRRPGRSRTGLYAVVGLLAAGLGVGAFIVTRAGDKAAQPAASGDRKAAAPAADVPAAVAPAPVEMSSEPTANAAAAEPTVKPAEPTVNAEPAVPPVEPTVKAEPTVATKSAPAIPAELAAKKPTAAKTAVVAKRPKPRAETKVEKKPDPKDQKSWNADSPFMPVRTK